MAQSIVASLAAFLIHTYRISSPFLRWEMERLYLWLERDSEISRQPSRMPSRLVEEAGSFCGQRGIRGVPGISREIRRVP